MDDTTQPDPETDRGHDDDHVRSEQRTNESSADVKVPFAPHEDDDSDFGDTDQHSTA